MSPRCRRAAHPATVVVVSSDQSNECVLLPILPIAMFQHADSHRPFGSNHLSVLPTTHIPTEHEQHDPNYAIMCTIETRDQVIRNRNRNFISFSRMTNRPS